MHLGNVLMRIDHLVWTNIYVVIHIRIIAGYLLALATRLTMLCQPSQTQLPDPRRARLVTRFKGHNQERFKSTGASPVPTRTSNNYKKLVCRVHPPTLKHH